MPEFKKVVLTTDFSENAAKAEAWAAAFAKQSGGSIDLVHVFEDTVYYFASLGNIALSNDFSTMLKQAFQHRQEELRQMAATLAEKLGVTVQPVLLKGSAAAKTVEYSDAHADVTVLATHGHSGWDRVLMGSVAEKIVSASKKPVLTVRSALSSAAAQGASIKKVMLPTDFSEHSLAALPHAADLAKKFGAALELVFVLDDKLQVPASAAPGHEAVASWMLKEHETTAAELKTRAEALRKQHGIAISETVLHGTPATVLVEHAKTIKADCVVLATHGRSGLSRLLMGSVAAGVVRQSACPVLTVRPASLT